MRPVPSRHRPIVTVAAAGVLVLLAGCATSVTGDAAATVSADAAGTGATGTEGTGTEGTGTGGTEGGATGSDPIRDAAATSLAPTTVPEGMGAPEPDGVFPRTMVHFGGTTTIQAAPERIVAISTGQLDALLTLGDTPVAVARPEDGGLVPDYLAEAFPDADLTALADVGTRTSPDLEAVNAARPDLILVNSTQEDLVPQLSAIAPTVVTEGTGVNWKRDLLMVADALGQEGDAQALIDGFATDAAAAGEQVGAAGTSTSLLRFTAGRTRIFGTSSFAGTIVADAGFARPPAQQFEDTSQDVSAEQIDLADGDWIFYGVQGDASATDAPAVTSGPLWPALTAVVADRAVVVDDDTWYLNAGPTAARLVLEDLTAALGG